MRFKASKPYICPTTSKDMFHQYIGDGGDLFIAIFVIVIGFAGALGYVDFLRQREKENKHEQ